MSGFRYSLKSLFYQNGESLWFCTKAALTSGHGAHDGHEVDAGQAVEDQPVPGHVGSLVLAVFLQYGKNKSG